MADEAKITRTMAPGGAKRQLDLSDLKKAYGDILQLILEDAADYFVQRAQEYVAKDTGFLMRSIGTVSTKDIVSALMSSIEYGTEAGRTKLTKTISIVSPYAIYQEYGTDPHDTPIEPLLKWVRRHGKPDEAAYKIRNAIRKRGLDPHPFVRPALEDTMKRLNVKLKEMQFALTTRKTNIRKWLSKLLIPMGKLKKPTLDALEYFGLI